MDADPWLDRWLPDIGHPEPAPAILELGCGEGRDTQTLLDAGFHHITAVDRRAEAVAACQARSPGIRCLTHDLHDPLPFDSGAFEVVLASLCLHYFEWSLTGRIVRDIQRVLEPGGLLLCRVNSTGDVHHGAAGFPELGPHLYAVQGHPKRFFDRADVDALLGAGWHIISAQELEIARYDRPKVVWEVVLRKP